MRTNWIYEYKWALLLIIVEVILTSVLKQQNWTT